MALAFPYSLAYFADQLSIQSVIWDVQRNDAMSGQGSGRIIISELAPPLWIGTVTLSLMSLDKARQAAAKVRALHGSQESFLIYDPMSKFPQNDWQGQTLAGRTILINTVGANRNAVSLSGLPAGFTLLPGDKISVGYGANPLRIAFLEVSEQAAANSGGVTPEFTVFPHVPTGLGAGQAATLLKPPCKCIIVPNSHNPGTATRMQVEGAGFKVIEKR